MADIGPLSSPDTRQDATAPSNGSHVSDPKNIPRKNGSDAENMPLGDVCDMKNKPPRSATQEDATQKEATQEDHNHHESETENADEEFDYEFANVSNHQEKCILIMNKVLSMDEEEYKVYRKKHPWPNMPSPKSCGPEAAFKYLREMYDDEDEEDAKESTSAGSQPTKKQ